MANPNAKDASVQRIVIPHARPAQTLAQNAWARQVHADADRKDDYTGGIATDAESGQQAEQSSP